MVEKSMAVIPACGNPFSDKERFWTPQKDGGQASQNDWNKNLKQLLKSLRIYSLFIIGDLIR